MMSGTSKGKEIRMYFLECEKIAKARTVIPQSPQTYLEALEALVVVEKEKLKLAAEVVQLQEVCDELFDYSSIVRIAKFNGVNENNFKWRTLKAQSKLLGLEVKTAPCPRFGTKKLYSHAAWLAAYPGVKLPVIDGIVIK